MWFGEIVLLVDERSKEPCTPLENYRAIVARNAERVLQIPTSLEAW